MRIGSFPGSSDSRVPCSRNPYPKNRTSPLERSLVEYSAALVEKGCSRFEWCCFSPRNTPVSSNLSLSLSLFNVVFAFVGIPPLVYKANDYLTSWFFLPFYLLFLPLSHHSPSRNFLVCTLCTCTCTCVYVCVCLYVYMFELRCILSIIAQHLPLFRNVSSCFVASSSFSSFFFFFRFVNALKKTRVHQRDTIVVEITLVSVRDHNNSTLI